MTTIGYAAMLEQFHPTDLLDWCAQAEGPASRPASWSASTSTRGPRSRARAPSPGRSWAPSASAPRCSFGTAVTCPGFRYHPAVIAHAAATLGAMYPGRFYLGLGAGEALNEHVIGGVWPEVPIRSAMMFEAIEIINKLFTGEVVQATRASTSPSSGPSSTPGPRRRCPCTSRRPVRSTPRRPASSPTGSSPSGAADEKMGMLWGKFEEGAREAGKDPSDARPRCSRSTSRGRRTDEEAIENAMVEWPNGGMAFFPKQDIKNPEDFAGMAKLVRPEDFKNRVLMTQRPGGPHQAHPALRGHGLRRGPPPQRRAQPGRVHRGLRQGGHPQPAARLIEAGSARARPGRPRRRSSRRRPRLARATTAALKATVSPAAARTPAVPAATATEPAISGMTTWPTRLPSRRRDMAVPRARWRRPGGDPRHGHRLARRRGSGRRPPSTGNISGQGHDRQERRRRRRPRSGCRASAAPGRSASTSRPRNSRDAIDAPARTASRAPIVATLMPRSCRARAGRRSGRPSSPARSCWRASPGPCRACAGCSGSAAARRPRRRSGAPAGPGSRRHCQAMSGTAARARAAAEPQGRPGPGLVAGAGDQARRRPAR